MTAAPAPRIAVARRSARAAVLFASATFFFLSGCASIGVGVGIPIGPFSIGVGAGSGGVSAGVSTGVGPVGVGVGVNQPWTSQRRGWGGDKHSHWQQQR